MNIELDGKIYDVPAEYRDKLIDQLWEWMLKDYDKIPESYRIGAMALTRSLLYALERDAAKKYGKEAAVNAIRPKKGTDPNKHLLMVMTAGLREGIKHATLTIDTETTATANVVSAFNISIPSQGEGGGQVAVDGNIGERQDNSLEVHRRVNDQTVPDQ